MAEALVSLLVEKLGGYIVQEAVKFTRVKKDLIKLQDELGRLRSFLTDADAKQHTNERVRKHVNAIKDLVADAEDVIETFILKQTFESGFIGKIASILKRPCRLSRLHSEIEEIRTTLSELKESMRDLGVVEIMDRADPSPALARQWEMRQTFPQIAESHVVGFEKNVEDLVARLAEERNGLQVISICGMGGIGKTTLAKQVFHHGEVRRHFDQFAWVCISQQCIRRNVWKEIYRNLIQKGDGRGIEDVADAELQEKLYEFLENNKCLVILDDIWQTEDWDAIKPIFPPKTGSKILLTTRKAEIGLHADLKGIIFNPKCLNPKDSWELFEKTLFCGRNDAETQIDERTKGLAEKMLNFCGGLPLAILALGGLLAQKDPLTEWNTVHETMLARGIGSKQIDDRVSQVLSLSYDDLPPHLRHCFLYLAHYPEDYGIDAETLIWRWIAEEMTMPVQTIKNHLGTTDHSIAEGYLEELGMRNMVLVEERSRVHLRIRWCRMHDVMRQFCLAKAEEENFLQVVQAGNQSSQGKISTSSGSAKPRKIAIHVDGDEMGREAPNFSLERLINPKSRTLLHFPCGSEGLEFRGAIFKGLRLLRVLDLRRCKFDGGRLPEEIRELIHLKYLNLQGTNLNELPSCIGDLRLLVYLNLYSYRREVYIPNVLKKLRELRYLTLPFELSSQTKLELGDLVNLEVLECFSLGNCDVRDLFHMTKLKELEIIIPEKYDEEFSLPSLGDTLKNLESFQFWVSGERGKTTNARQVVSEFTSVNYLELKARMDRLPDAYLFPPHLVSISLGGCKMAEDPMPVLEKLPQLKELVLFLGAFTGRKMVCSESGFPQLHFLRLDLLPTLAEWIVEEGSMPRLCLLEIGDCRELKMLPDGLKYVRTLQKLVIPKTFKERVDKGGEDYYKVQHIPSVVFGSQLY